MRYNGEDDATAYAHGFQKRQYYPARATGWKRESQSYWSEDPLLAWIGACPHPKCQCEAYLSPHNGEITRRCGNADCPWDFMAKPEPLSQAAPDALQAALARRFGGLEFD